MFEVFGVGKDRIKKKESTSIDGNVFKLHYKLTCAILLVFATVVVTSQYIGDPIDCLVDEVPFDVMDAYCWIYSTFTVQDDLGGRISQDVAQGVKPYVAKENTVKHHKYYQWVCFVLLFQAILFYLPHFLWKSLEKQRLNTLAEQLKNPDNVDLVVNYFVDPINKSIHKSYAFKLVSCELLNFVNVVGQIFLLDCFLDGEFSTYGLKVFDLMEQEDPFSRSDPMAQIFPKVTKCNFKKYGPSGTLQNFDGLCILPLNIVNEKIFAFLWFWFIILAIVTGGHFLYRIISIQFTSLRTQRLRTLIYRVDLEDINSLEKTKKEKLDVISVISDSYQIGDWYILCQLAKHADPITYITLTNKLAAELKSRN